MLKKYKSIELLGPFYLVLWLISFFLDYYSEDILPFLATGLLLTFFFEFKNPDKNYLKTLALLFGILPATSIFTDSSYSILELEMLTSALLSLALLLFYVLRFAKKSDRLDPIEWTKLVAVFIFCFGFIAQDEIVRSFSFAVLGFVFIATRSYQLQNISIMLKRTLTALLIFFSVGLIIFSAIKANEASKMHAIATERVFQIEAKLAALKKELDECQKSNGGE